MNQRERIILIITIVVGVLGVVFYLLPERFLGGDEAAAGSVGEARKDFQDSFKFAQSEAAILRAYQKVNTQIPERQEGSTPETTFSNEVARMLQDRGWERPSIKPGKAVDIKGVSDYYYIDLELTLSGARKKITDVLVAFDQEHLMIKSFQIEKKNMDADNVDLKVIVSRLARAEPEKNKRPKRRAS